MSSRRADTIHISAEIGMTRSSKCRVFDSLCIQAKADLLRIVLPSGQRSWDHFGLETVSPSSLVLVRIIVTGRLSGLCVSIMKDLLEVLDGLPFFDRW